jgi:hypothetical protein
VRVPVTLLESALSEAIQPAQWDKALRKLSRQGPNYEEVLLNLIGAVDPTVDFDIDPTASEQARKVIFKNKVMQGKYASWLLKQRLQAVALREQADWILANQEKAIEQGIVNPAEVEDTGWGDLENPAVVVADRMKQAGDKQIAWLGSSEGARKALATHEKLVRLGQAEQAGVNPDINTYKDYRELEAAIGATVIREDPAPLAVHGSEIVYNENGIVIFECSTQGAVMAHAADSAWCLRHADWATKYLKNSLVYIVYGYRNSAAWENAQKNRKVEAVEGLYKLWGCSTSSSPRRRSTQRSVLGSADGPRDSTTTSRGEIRSLQRGARRLPLFRDLRTTKTRRTKMNIPCPAKRVSSCRITASVKTISTLTELSVSLGSSTGITPLTR